MSLSRRSLLSGIAGASLAHVLSPLARFSETEARVMANPYYTVGLNITGAQIYNNTDHKDVYSQGYIYPYDRTALTTLYQQGMTVVQLPFKIERVWPDFSSEFNWDEVQRIIDFVWLASDCGLKTCLSPHNYGRYGTIPVADIKGLIVGTPEYPNETFAEFWRRFAEIFVNNPSVWGYEIDTEPNNMGPNRWQNAAQAAVNAIREVDQHNLVVVPGADHWASAPRWMEYSKDLHVVDPVGNIAYSATVYGDDTMEGIYVLTDTFYPDILADRIMPFAEWLDDNNHTGFITEWGVPTGEAIWLDAAVRMLERLRTYNIGSFGWAYGWWWPEDYNLYVDPAGEMAQVLGEYNQLGPKTR